MTYTRTYDPDKYKHLKEDLEEILDLNPGEVYTMTYDNREDLNKDAWLFANWRFHHQLQGLFRIKQEGLLTLRILRLGGTHTGRREGERLSLQIEKILEKMLASDDPITLLRELRQAGSITPEEMGVLLTKYDEIMK